MIKHNQVSLGLIKWAYNPFYLYVMRCTYLLLSLKNEANIHNDENHFNAAGTSLYGLDNLTLSQPKLAQKVT